MNRSTTDAPGRSVDRRPRWDLRKALGTSGARMGTSGGLAMPPAAAVGALAAIIAGIDTVNVFSAVADAARYGRILPAWQPAVWEGTSGLSTLLLSILVASALRLAPPGRSKASKLIAVHIPAAVTFSLLHVGIMRVLRISIYALMGERYAGPPEWLYELRKDVLSYALIALVIVLTTKSKDTPAHATPSATAPEPTFDIVDGPDLIRAAPATIKAVKAAGNYVEFHLADGRKPLMRTPMQDVEAKLSPLGFVRTHRSWLVNASMVREVSKDGSGGASLLLDDGLTVPLARRYGAARAAIGC